MLVTLAGMLYSTQLYFVAPTVGMVLMSSAYSSVPAGAPVHANGGDFDSPSQVNVVGSVPFTTPVLDTTKLAVGAGGVVGVVAGAVVLASPPHAPSSSARPTPQRYGRGTGMESARIVVSGMEECRTGLPRHRFRQRGAIGHTPPWPWWGIP